MAVEQFITIYELYYNISTPITAVKYKLHCTIHYNIKYNNVQPYTVYYIKVQYNIL